MIGLILKKKNVISYSGWGGDLMTVVRHITKFTAHLLSSFFFVNSYAINRFLPFLMNQAQISVISTHVSDYSQTMTSRTCCTCQLELPLTSVDLATARLSRFFFVPKNGGGVSFFFFLLFHDIMATAADWPVSPAFSSNIWQLNRFTKTWIRVCSLRVVGGRWPAGLGAPGLCLIKGTKNVTRQFSELGTWA